MADVLVTCGATRNPVDAIRYLSANATGTTGIALTRALAPRHAVHLLGSVEACLRAGGGETYGSTRDLMARMERWCRAHPRGVVIHSAAVGDYEASSLATKIPSGQAELVLRLTPTPKIVDHVRAWAPEARLVSFKAGSPELDEAGLEALARQQLARTGSDLVWANVLGRLEVVLFVEAERITRFTDRAEAVRALAERVDAWAIRPG